MSAPNLFLDMDGVVADFDATLALRGHVALGDFYVRKHPKDWTPEEQAHSDDTQKCMQDLQFWTGMLPFRGARSFVDELMRIWPGKLVILTALPANEQAPAIAIIKKVWCWKHLGLYPRDVITTQRHLKASFASSGGLLVDDLEKNCLEFKAAGGFGLQHTSFENTITELRKLINVN